MTTNLTPKSSDDDMPGVVEIIKLLSDPDAYSKRLAELRGLAASADSRLADAKALEEKYAATSAMIADASRMLADHKRRGDELNDRDRDISGREDALEKAKSEHQNHLNTTADNLASREQATVDKEKNAAGRLVEVQKLEQALNEREALIAGREAKMREIARLFPPE